MGIDMEVRKFGTKREKIILFNKFVCQVPKIVMCKVENYDKS